MENLAFVNNPVPWIVLIVVLVLFGGAKIPEMMRGLGQGVKELKKGMNDDEDDELRKDKEKEKERLRAEVRAEVEREASKGNQ